MAQYLRRLRDIDAWADAEGSDQWTGSDCPPAVLVQLYDPGGISIWKIDDEVPAARILAAISFGETKIKDAVFVTVEESELRRLRLKVQPSKGKTPDYVANDRHYEIVDLSGRALIRLAEVFRPGSVGSYAESELISEAAKRVAAHQYNRDRLKPELTQYLWKRNYLQLAVT